MLPVRSDPVRSARDLDPHRTLVERLHHLASTATSTPACLFVRAVHGHRLKSVQTTSPVLAIPLVGSKRAFGSRGAVSASPGELLLIDGPASVDLENLPDPAHGVYAAIGIALDDNVLDAARRLRATALRLASDATREAPVDVSVLPLAVCTRLLEDWCAAAERGDSLMARHALVGIALRLDEAGHRGVLQPRPATVAVQIGRLVGAAPGRDWSSGEIEAALSMSGATLRRRLASEGSSLRRVVSDARLTAALSLLLGTRLPVKTVALRVGYASVASFARRFEARYGLAPSRVSNA